MRTTLLTLLTALILAAPSLAAATVPAESALDEQAVLDSLMTFDQPMYEELTRLRARVGPDDPQYKTRLQKARGRARLALDHPEWATAEGKFAEVEAEVHRQATLYRAAQTDEEKQPLYAQLQQLATQAHDLRLDSYRFRIAVLEMRLQEMEGTVQARERDRARFIQEYLDRELRK